MTNLAGNMMTLPVVLALVMATLTAAPWNDVSSTQPSLPMCAAEVDQALAVLATLPHFEGTRLQLLRVSGSSPEDMPAKKRHCRK